MVTAELATELEQVEALAPGWDQLAIACGAPVATPAWGLAWWRHVAPANLALRVIAICERRRLIGVVPMYVERSPVVAYRLLADSWASSLRPLALPGREYEVVEAAARVLAGAQPRPARVDLGPVPLFSPWAGAFRERWPGRMRPLAFRTRLEAVPVVTVDARSFDQWLSDRDERVRANARRRRRRFAEQGGTYRLATAATLRRDLEAYVELHAARWEGRGRSRYLALGDRLIPFFETVARPLLGEDRFRLLMVELDGVPICAEISLVAGGEIASVTAGWDPRHRRLGPARLALLRSIEEACRRGERRLELGWGNLEDKQQYADAVDALGWDSLLIPGRGLLRTLPRAAPSAAGRRLRQTAKRTLSDSQLDRLRALSDRVSSA